MNDEVAETRMAAGVGAANIPSLLMVLVQLTGDLRWLEAPYRPRRGRGVSDNDDGGLPEPVVREIRNAATAAITDWIKTGAIALPRPDDDLLVRMLSVAMGEPVPPEYGPMIAHDLAAVAGLATVAASEAKSAPAADDFHVVVIGAGVSGLCAAYRLRQAGIAFTVIEKAATVGGTWRDNRYPGAGVDTPNHLYSFSFAPFEWTRFFVLRDEIFAYLQDVSRRFDLDRDIRLSTNVRSARYDEVGQIWRVEVESAKGVETLVANVIVSGAGLFNPPKRPQIAGLDSFGGPCIHTALWPSDLTLDGRDVALIGSGASAMQTVPAIADRVRSLTIFQRSPSWFAPFEKFQVKVSDDLRGLLRDVPLYRAWYRLRLGWIWNDRLYESLHKDPAWPHPDRSLNPINDAHRDYFTEYALSELGDRQGELREKVVPTYPPYIKRMLMDNGWARTVARPHVSLVNEPIAHVEPEGIRTRDGDLHKADVLILATGFDVQRFLSTFDLIGRGGRNLRDAWGEEDASAYLGAAIPGYPNFFCLYGPNAQPGAGGSIVCVIEAQMNFVMSAITQMRGKGLASIEILPDVHGDYNARLDEANGRMVWTHPGVETYYRNTKGRVTVNLPYRNIDLWRMTQKADLGEFICEPATNVAQP